MKNVFTLAFILFCACSFGQKTGINLKGKPLLDWVEKVNELGQGNKSSRAVQSRLIATSYTADSCAITRYTNYIYNTNSGGSVLFNLPLANENEYDQELTWAADSVIRSRNNGSCILILDQSSSIKQTIVNNKIAEAISFDGKSREKLSYNSDNLNTDYYSDTILSNANWGEYYHYQFLYNANKKMTTVLAQYKQGTTWQNEKQSRFLYNGSNELVQIVEEDWDGGSSSWKKTNETNVYYVSAGIKSVIKEKSFTNNDSSFTYFIYSGNLIKSDSNINIYNAIRINQYTYDIASRIIKKTYHAYAFGQPNYQEDTTFTTYNSYGQKLTESVVGTAKNYMTNWYWEEYNGPSAIRDLETVSETKFYPNPVSEIATLSYSLKSNETISINLIDITGRIVQNIVANKLQSAGTYKLDINFEPQTQSGTYFLQIKGEHINSTLKVMKW
jgi:hypothetical protein